MAYRYNIIARSPSMDPWKIRSSNRNNANSCGISWVFHSTYDFPQRLRVHCHMKATPGKVFLPATLTGYSSIPSSVATNLYHLYQYEWENHKHRFLTVSGHRRSTRSPLSPHRFPSSFVFSAHPSSVRPLPDRFRRTLRQPC